MQATLGIRVDELRDIRIQAYAAAVRAVLVDDTVSADEEAELGRLQSFLGLDDAVIAPSKQQLARARLMKELETGALPVISVPGLVLRKDEVAHWAEPAQLLGQGAIRLTSAPGR